MNFKEAEDLLNKYWECEASLDEEESLREFFRQDNLPENLQKYKDLFLYYDEQKNSALDEAFDEKLINQINKRGKERKFLISPIWYKVAAAVILILTFAVLNRQFGIFRQKATIVMKDTFSDPDKALLETKRVLLLVSEKLNKGNSEMAKISEFNKVEKVLKKENLKEI